MDLSLVALRGPVGYWLLATVRTLAAAGILQEFGSVLHFLVVLRFLA